MFFRRKAKEEKKQETTLPVEESVENKDELMKEAEEHKEAAASLTGSEKAQLLSKAGAAYFQAKEYDLAIEVYEESLSIDDTLLHVHSDLMKLYNQKRKEAAMAKNGEEVMHWLDKVDEISALSKRIVRERA